MASREPVATNTQAPSDDIWLKCQTCKEIAFRKEVERNLNVCPKCGHHFRLTVSQRLAITVDRGSWREMVEDLRIDDPLEFTEFHAHAKRRAPAGQASERNRPLA